MPLLLKSPVIHVIAVRHRRALEYVVRVIDHNGLKPIIQQRYGFDDLPSALEALVGGPFGKAVVELR